MYLDDYISDMHIKARFWKHAISYEANYTSSIYISSYVLQAPVNVHSVLVQFVAVLR